MKKALLATLIGAAFAADASAAVIDFSYGNGDTSFYGFQKKETYDIAVFLPGDIFEGMKLKSVSVPVYAAKGIDGYSDAKVWLSSELKLENKKNAPDIATYDADFAATDDTLAELSLSLPEEYTVTADGVYVGYSITVDKLDSGTRYPIALTSGGAEGSFYLHSTTSAKTWQAQNDISGLEGLASAMTVTLDADNLSAANVSLTGAPELVYMSFGETKTVKLSLLSTASAPVESVDVEFSMAGTPYTQHCVLETPVPAGILRNFTVQVELPAQSEKMSETVEFKVTKVNGVANSSASPSASTEVSVFEIAPIQQTLIEEYTGTWCGYCPRGFAALEHIAKNYPDFVVASYHNGDDMTITSSYPASISGYPSASLNRKTVVDPYYGTQNYNMDLPIVGDIEEMNSKVSPWAIEVSHTWDYDNILTATVDGLNVEGYDAQNYKIGYLLVCDGLSNEKWKQSNYYSSYAPQYIPELNQFCKGGEYGSSYVQGLVFNDVVVSVEGYKGVANSLPASLAAGEKFMHSKSWDLNEVKDGLIPDKNKLRVIAFVLDKSGKPLNCTKEDITDYVETGNQGTLSAVEGIFSEDADAPVEYFSISGVKVANPQGGIFIRRQGGKAEKVVIR